MFHVSLESAQLLMKKGKRNQIMWAKELGMEFLGILSIPSPVASWLLPGKSQCSP